MADPIADAGEGLTLDGFVQTNPAFCAYCLHYVCGGYRDGVGSPDASLPVFPAIWSLSLLAPDRVRAELPQTAGAKLGLLLERHPEWRARTRSVVLVWVAAFWAGVRYGCARGALTWRGDGLAAVGKVRRGPDGTLAEDVRKRATALGKLIAAEGGEAGLLSALGVGFE